jgi:hypothetical protein
VNVLRIPTLGAAFLAGAALAEPALATATLAAAEGGAALVVTGGEGRVEVADGRVIRLRLPPGALPSALQEVDGGWLISGSHGDARRPSRLFFLRSDPSDAGAARALPPPAAAAPRARQLAPLAFVDGGRLAGAAWLEGERLDALGVRAAVWDGARFRRPRWVSPPQTGSQMAPAGAVLADGSWLLAWTAFDGEDDEVVWSRRVGSDWQRPARVDADDAWPDITPALIAGSGGALLAWSSYDGESYRTVLSRFDGRRWRPASRIGGAGSLYPALRGAGSGTHLLFFDAPGGAWQVVELDARGEVRRRAAARTLAGDEAPLLEVAGPGIVLRWPGRKGATRGAWRDLR